MSFELDPDKGAFLFTCGHKGAGKSEWAKHYFRSYPYGRLVIDANGDVDPDGAFTCDYRPPVELVRPRKEGKPPVYLSPVPSFAGEDEWAPVNEGTWPSWRYEIDFTDPDWRYVVDAVIGDPPSRHRAGSGMLGAGEPVMIWVDEIGEFAPAGGTPPRFEQALHKGRHVGLTLACAGPRVKAVNPLCVSQADLAAIFDTPHELDRQRLAEHLGISYDELSSHLDNLEQFGFLCWEGPPVRQLSVMPPLPQDLHPRTDHRGERARSPR